MRAVVFHKQPQIRTAMKDTNSGQLPKPTFSDHTEAVCNCVICKVMRTYFNQPIPILLLLFFLADAIQNQSERVVLLERRISPSQGRYLHRTTGAQNRRHICICKMGFEPTIPVIKRAKTLLALDREAIVIGSSCFLFSLIHSRSFFSFAIFSFCVPSLFCLPCLLYFRSFSYLSLASRMIL
jgi:hypothetical protein